MSKKFTEKELLSLVKGIKLPANDDAIRALGIKILETEPYDETKNIRYLNSRYNPVVISTDYFNVSLTFSVNEMQAKKIEKLCKDDYQRHKENLAIAAIIAAGYSEKEAIAMLKRKGK